MVICCDVSTNKHHIAWSYVVMYQPKVITQTIRLVVFNSYDLIHEIHEIHKNNSNTSNDRFSFQYVDKQDSVFGWCLHLRECTPQLNNNVHFLFQSELFYIKDKKEDQKDEAINCSILVELRQESMPLYSDNEIMHIYI